MELEEIFDHFRKNHITILILMWNREERIFYNQ